ncbi:putative glutathione-dependent formaldehyde-activating enzyme [Colletotrichum sublineola]|uniref:Putative glutathione-dependent formaldehyde-activating enzyme n=1 Tax=Colletotrichum sublineola TaxID=1173701 RepID=A0A066XHC2_COLSU|nr:putative glutathione-dependent formaldehyde-activating enzyme [Colletotrichum sublineola]
MATSEVQEPKRTYRGNCHCAAFVYEVDTHEIKSLSQCNCSICVKRGALWITPAHENFRVVKGAESELSSYKFGSGQMIHKVMPFAHLDVLIRLNHQPGFHPADILSSVNGASWGSKYEVPAHKGPNPTAEIEGGKLYTGGCHCGAVTVAVMSKPIDETYEDSIIECNCSICVRNAYIWVKPGADQVVLSGDDNSIGRYTFSHRILAKTFCKTCGVPLTSQHNPLTEEERNALAEDVRYWHDWSKDKHPVNARALDGVDLKSLKVHHVDGKTEFQPGYVNP